MLASSDQFPTEWIQEEGAKESPQSWPPLDFIKMYGYVQWEVFSILLNRHGTDACKYCKP